MLILLYTLFDCVHNIRLIPTINNWKIIFFHFVTVSLDHSRSHSIPCGWCHKLYCFWSLCRWDSVASDKNRSACCCCCDWLSCNFFFSFHHTACTVCMRCMCRYGWISSHRTNTHTQQYNVRMPRARSITRCAHTMLCVIAYSAHLWRQHYAETFKTRIYVCFIHIHFDGLFCRNREYALCVCTCVCVCVHTHVSVCICMHEWSAQFAYMIWYGMEYMIEQRLNVCTKHTYKYGASEMNRCTSMYSLRSTVRLVSFHFFCHKIKTDDFFIGMYTWCDKKMAKKLSTIVL